MSSVPGESLLERIAKRKEQLRQVQTIVSDESGQQSVQHRLEDGTLIKQPLPTRSNGFVVDLKPDLQMAEIIPRLFLGSQDVAVDADLLNAHKITHVLCLIGHLRPFADSITYLTLQVLDEPNSQLQEHFEQCASFIDNALSQPNQCVLVHCNAGVSRAPSVCIAFLMRRRQIRLMQAFDLVKAVRPSIKPNKGFWQQLQALDKQLFEMTGKQNCFARQH